MENSHNRGSSGDNHFSALWVPLFSSVNPQALHNFHRCSYEQPGGINRVIHISTEVKMITVLNEDDRGIPLTKPVAQTSVDYDTIRDRTKVEGLS